MTLPNKLAAKHSMAVRIEIAQLEAQLTEAETACAEAIQQRKGAVVRVPNGVVNGIQPSALFV